MAERIGVILEPRARGFDKVDGQRNVLHLEHRHCHLYVFTHGMDVLALNELVVEVIELIVEQLHDRGGCIFDVERDLRVADLHDVSLLAAHLERFGQHLDRAGDVALGHIADDLAADLDVLLVELADLDLNGADGRRFDLHAVRRDLRRVQDRVADGLLARVGDGRKVAHEPQLARVKVVDDVARHLEL